MFSKHNEFSPKLQCHSFRWGKLGHQILIKKKKTRVRGKREVGCVDILIFTIKLRACLIAITIV